MVKQKKDLVRTGIAADELGVTQQTIINWASKGYLKVYKKPSNRYLVSITEVEKIKNEMMQEAGVQNE